MIEFESLKLGSTFVRLDQAKASFLIHSSTSPQVPPIVQNYFRYGGDKTSLSIDISNSATINKNSQQHKCQWQLGNVPRSSRKWKQCWDKTFCSILSFYCKKFRFHFINFMKIDKNRIYLRDIGWRLTKLMGTLEILILKRCIKIFSYLIFDSLLKKKQRSKHIKKPKF